MTEKRSMNKLMNSMGLRRVDEFEDERHAGHDRSQQQNEVPLRIQTEVGDQNAHAQFRRCNEVLHERVLRP